MATLGSDRATGRAFFSDLDGGNIIDFQFAPFTLDFEEGGQYEQRTQIGRHFTDAVWISGKPNMFNLNMFVDRTNESVPMDLYDMPYNTLRRFPERQYSQYNPLQAASLVRGMMRSDVLGDKDFKQSEYFANPAFADGYDPARGIYPDLERLLQFVRPVGVSVDNNTIRNSGEVNLEEFEEYRFVAPPMVRFYYGTHWRECYMTSVKYRLSAMNKELVPRRFEADISLIAIRWGYLENVTNFNDSISTDRGFGSGEDYNSYA